MSITMNKNKIKDTLKNILKVAFSNIFTVIAGVIVGFALPKMIGITNYGYYKTFFTRMEVTFPPKKSHFFRA